MATYYKGVQDGLQIALDDVDLAIRTFDADPPDNAKMQGFLDGLKSARHDIGITLGNLQKGESDDQQHPTTRRP